MFKMVYRIMKMIRRMIIIIFCIIIVWIAYKIWQPHRKDKALESANALYDLLIQYEFDGYDIDKADQSVILFEYMKESEDSSILIQEEVTRLDLSSKERKHLSRFKEVRSTHDGILFATLISMDGEWKGIFITESDFPTDLERYSHEMLAPGRYWFDYIPDHRMKSGYQRKRERNSEMYQENMY